MNTDDRHDCENCGHAAYAHGAPGSMDTGCGGCPCTKYRGPDVIRDNEMRRTCATCGHRYGEHTDGDQGPCNELNGECICRSFVGGAGVETQYGVGDDWSTNNRLEAEALAIAQDNPIRVRQIVPLGPWVEADNQPAETQYGVAVSPTITEPLMSGGSHEVAARIVGEGYVMRQRLVGPWRPFDGAPGEDSQT